MKVQIQFNCPVGVIVDTDAGTIESVHVWDESLDTTQPTGASRDEYVKVGHPDFERAIAADEPEMQQLSRRYGRALFEPMALDDPNVEQARAIIARGDQDWPAWEFGP